MRKFSWLIVAAVIGWWALNGLVSTVQLLAVLESRGRPASVGAVLGSEMGSAALWIPCTLWLFWCVGRMPIERERWLRPAIVLLAAALAVGLFRSATLLVLHPLIGWYNAPPQWNDVLIGSAFKEALRAFLIIGAGHAVFYAQRASLREREALELRERLTKSQLDVLAAQLNPHFLFNSLNSIAEMVHHDADAADRMLVQLSGLLRHSLESGGRQHTSLRDELAIVECYIAIEQVRFGERLQFHQAVDEAALDAQVPRLVLQPLVENAVRHAVAHRSTVSRVEVSARANGDRLVLDVIDEGAGTAPKPGFGIGLANTRARLQCLYGAAQSLEIAELPDGGTRVRLSIPFIRNGSS